MASSILAGFVKGFADTELDFLKERRKQEAAMKQAQMLDQLRRETAQWEYTTLGGKERDTRQAAADARAAAKAERDAEYEAQLRPLELQSRRQQLSLDAQRAAREERESRARIASYGRSGKSGGLDDSSAAPTLQEAAREIKFQNQDLLNSLTSGENAPLSLDRAENVLLGILDNTRTAADADRRFREYLISVGNEGRRRAGLEGMSMAPRK